VRNAKKLLPKDIRPETFLTALPPLLLAICICFWPRPSLAQVLSPSQQVSLAASKALSSAVAQGIPAATAQALSPAPSSPSSLDQATLNAVDQSVLSTPGPEDSSSSQSMDQNKTKGNTPSGKPQGFPFTHAAPVHAAAAPVLTPPKPPPPPPKPAQNARRTLFVEIGQKKLRLEAPKKMCFLDRTSPLQEKIFLLLSTAVEKRHDQVLLGVFMACDGIMSPEDWLNGMPDAGFVTWLNPSIGETTPMNRQDYLDMREASFPQYAKSRALGLALDKAVHRNAYNVSLGVSDEQPAVDGIRHKSTNVLSTTILRHIPVEVTLHYTGDIYAGKAPLEFPEAYAAMDKLMAQQISLNE
jgi:hypothetical protein